MTREQFIEKSRNKHGYKYTYIDIPDKLTQKDYINIIFNDIKYTQRVSKHLIGKCPEKYTAKKSLELFIIESKKIWGDDRFNYSNIEYNGSLERITIYDNLNKKYINQIASLHLLGHEYKSIDSNLFIEESKIIGDYRYEYNECHYINKTSNVKLFCKKHGYFSIKPFNHLNYGTVCNKCQFTNFNKIVKRILNNTGIIYDMQYKFNDINLPFDFYIKNLRCVIDFTYDDIDQIKINDKIKSNYCEDNYIDLIRIRYDQIDKIEEILNNNLSEKLKLIHRNIS